MNKKLISLSTIFTVLILISIYLIVKDNKNESIAILDTQETEIVVDKTQNETKDQNPSVVEKSQTEDIILFYGDGCPHCAIVDEFIKENGIDKKISFSQKEVYYNKQNAGELIKKAEMCGVNTDSIGVPFLWDGTGCLVGDQDIVEFFRLKTSQ